MIQETGTNQHSSLYIYTDQSSYEPLARIDKRGNDPEKVMYFHTDLNGAPEELTDENGKILWECSFQLWGKRIHEIEHIPIQQNLRYQGQYLDRETGLHYNTFRYYDPDIGRFTQPDPIGLLGGFNLYQYAPNGLTWIDPWGLSCGSDAVKLRKNMQNKRYLEPKYKNSAHHIVMSNTKDKLMQELRDKMGLLGIDINSAVNGVYLPTSSKVKANAKTEATAHSKVHTQKYKENVYNRLKDIDNAADFKKELKNIASELSNGTFQYK
jgi:RHS repeat-associated protein